MSERGDWRKDLADKQQVQGQLVYDACKHFTTLNTAAILVALAIFNQLGASLLWAVGPLLLFVISLALCALGMLGTAMGGLWGGLGDDEGLIRVTWRLFFGVAFFFGGLVFAVVYILLLLYHT